MKLKKARSCASCRACSGSDCSLNFKTTRFARAKDCVLDKNGDMIWCKPAEPCLKPKTISELISL